jgi:hypothetical protein
MRDIYNREKKLKTWTERIKIEFEDYDKSDTLMFVEYMREKEKSILWIAKCIAVLIQIRISSKQILQSYINPLINENYIDRIDSEIDKRAYIYFPVLETRNSKSFLSPERDNGSQESKIVITDSASYPNK